MTEELNKEFEKVKEVDDEIKSLETTRKLLVDNFLKKLPFQSGDKVVNKDGVKFIIDRLKDATSVYGGIYIGFTVFKIKNDGKPYSNPVNGWSCVGDYFSLKKIDD